MNFEELHNTVKNFCNAHSFEASGEPVFDYDHQCYNYDVRSTFYNSLRNAAFKNEKLANILVRLTKKENLNNKEKLTIHVLRILESLLEKHEHFEDEYIGQSNRAKSHKKLQSLHLNYNTVTRDVKRMIKQCYSLIEDLENGNIREDFETLLLNSITKHLKLLREFESFGNRFYRHLADPLNEQYYPERENFETEQEYLQCVQELQKEKEEYVAKFEVQHQEYEALIADSLAKIKQQLSELYPEAKSMKLAS